MDSDPDLIERIDAMGISTERNLAVIVLLVNIVLVIQGVTILLFVLVINGLVLSVGVGLLGSAILLLGVYALSGNIKTAGSIMANTSKSREELLDPPEKP